MNDFVNAAKAVENETTTTNGMPAYKSTLNANLDFFAKSGNMQYPSMIEDFENALAEDKDIALRNLLHMRDVRGGKGIRDNFRQLLVHLRDNHPSLIQDTKLIKQIPEVGRWDDLFVLVDNEHKTITNKVIKFLGTEFKQEAPNALLCKWLPMKGIVASKMRSYVKMLPADYRKRIVANKKVVETQMSARKWSDIVYQHVPSRAMMIYSKAFRNRDTERFERFIEKVNNGEEKINAGAVWPHEVAFSGNGNAADAMWKNLPDYLPEDKSILVMVDVSGSMECTAYGKYNCMDIAVALGIYCAERNKSAFKNLFLTFDSQPEFVSLEKCKTLKQKIEKTKDAEWGGSTNIEAAFEMVLNLAVKNKVSAKDMPSSIMLISDMQFNSAIRGYNDHIMQMLRRQYEEAGYSMPNIIFWRVDAGVSNMPVKFDENGTCILSSYSPSIITSIFTGQYSGLTPMTVMMNALNNDRYSVMGMG